MYSIIHCNKEKYMELNMTRGKPLTIILRFVLPIFLGNVFQQFYNMIDMIIVGKFVGADALAGVGSTGTIMFLVIGLSIGMTVGFSVLTSQKYGAGDEEATRETVANGIILSLLVALFMTTFSLIIMKRLLHLMNTPPEIYPHAYSYITTICKGIVATIFYNLFSSYLRAIGNSKVPLYFLIFSSGLNIGLDLVFIVILGRGTLGAAEATILSQGLSALLCLLYILRYVPTLRPHRTQWKLYKGHSRGQLAIGLPMSLQYGITASGAIVMQSAINLFGPTAVAAFSAASKTQMLLTQGLVSLGQGMASYAGQNYGSGDFDRVEQGTRDAMKIVIVYSIVAGAIAILGFKPMLALFFSSDIPMKDIYSWAWIYMLECVSCFFFLGAIFVYRNTMQGCGYGVHAMTMGIIELFARSGAAALAIILTFYPLACGADACAWFTGGVFGYIMYRYVMKKIRSTDR